MLRTRMVDTNKHWQTRLPSDQQTSGVTSGDVNEQRTARTEVACSQTVSKVRDCLEQQFFVVSFLKKLLTSEFSAGLRETKTNEWHRHHIHHVVTTAASILAMSNEQVQFLPLQTDEACVPSQHLISKARVIPIQRNNNSDVETVTDRNNQKCVVAEVLSKVCNFVCRQNNRARGNLVVTVTSVLSTSHRQRVAKLDVRVKQHKMSSNQ